MTETSLPTLPPPGEREPSRARSLHLPVLQEPCGLGFASPPRHETLQDGHQRTITYLRISLTDRCNYRCTYCMPSEGIELVPKADILRLPELEEIVSALIRVGVRRVRLTGGEPTVRKDLVDLVARLAGLGLADLSLSTNGQRLTELAQPLRRAGLHRINVSLDTLDAARFRRVTRRGQLAQVLAGLEAVRAAGFRHTKMNTVAMRGFNDDEVATLCRYAFERDFIPRFIELMPIGEGTLGYPGTFLPTTELRQILRREFGSLCALSAAEDRPPGVGPARYVGVSYQGQPRRVGLISAVSEPFCDSCNRIRLSATGSLHTCLAYDDATELADLLRSQDPALREPLARQRALRDRIQTVLQRKRSGHAFTSAGCGGPAKHMVAIGG